ncbi:MAG: carboxypeptidase-like regulatory domain-containing protein, partial [Schleiferiaceae bacterium]|nr:carboxypeptidase-like regulatory domain-containing protein [Schleiferiaceae bacterium]
MRNRNKQLILLVFCFSGYLLKAQSIQISGNIVDNKTKEPIGNVVVKSANTAVIADLNGKFNIDVESLPVVLNFSTFGYTARDLSIIQSTKPITVKLKVDQVVLAEAQIVASRITEKQKQAPLTVEALDLISIKEAPALNFYEALGSMKGVDLTSASIGFKIINTRGFN